MKQFPGIMLILLCSLVPIFGQAEYPGPVSFWETELSSGVQLNGAESPGGLLELSIGLGEYWRGLGTELRGTYSWATLPSGALEPALQTQLLLQWNQELIPGIALRPYAGGGAGRSFGDNEVELYGVMELGLGLDFHLHKESYLSLRGGWHYSFAGPGPQFRLGLGYRRRRPVLMPVPEIEVELIQEGLPYSPDGDGVNDEYYLVIQSRQPRAFRSWQVEIRDPQGELFYQEQGWGTPPEGWHWDGRSFDKEWVSSALDYQLIFRYTDLLGNTKEEQLILNTDILVIQEDNRLKIRIPSIHFPADSGDFSQLEDPAQIAENERIIARLAEIFAKYPRYSIQVEGHANNLISHSEEARQIEQEEVLIPLSHARAEAVRQALIDLGIEEDRITALGLGGEVPLFPVDEHENLWKNRRVEFILVR